MDVVVTKESALVLSVCYKIFRNRKKAGQDFDTAAHFEFFEDFEDRALSGLGQRDIMRCVDELAKSGLMKSYSLDFSLTALGIATVEKNSIGKDDVQRWINTLLEATSTVVTLVLGV